MKTDSTIDTMAAVTPKRAMARRSHTTWHRRAQNPETTKNAKNQRSRKAASRAAHFRRGAQVIRRRASMGSGARPL